MRKEHKSPSGGLTAAGRRYFKNKEGADLKPPAPNPKTKKAAGRKRSFCARMSGVKGPMRKNGKPTRKALALRKWKC
tara:strand:- start:109 stop:339 length:231 start_codon:yes stop_codon:yes gene_type:complete